MENLRPVSTSFGPLAQKPQLGTLILSFQEETDLRIVCPPALFNPIVQQPIEFLNIN